MSVPSDASPPRAPLTVERFADQLNVTFKAVRLYPVASTIPKEAAAATLVALKKALEVDPVVLLEVTKDGLRCDGAPILPKSEGFQAFAREFYARNLAEVRFRTGTMAVDVIRFVKLLDADPGEVAAQGGFEAILWQSGTTNVTVTEVSTRFLEAEIEDDVLEAVGSDIEHWPPSTGEISEIIDGSAAGNKRDRRVLVRVMRDPVLAAAYLKEATRQRRDVASFVDMVARLSAFARAVESELPEDQASLMRSLADSVMTLEPETRAALYRSRLLEEARREESVAGVVRELGLTEAFDSILLNIQETPSAQAGLARAIRNLAFIHMADTKERLLDAAAERMSAAGLSDGFADSVLEAAAPSTFAAKERVRSDDTEPAAAVLRLLDLSAKARGVASEDEALAPLRDEAARGTTDGDVIAALVTIATVERRPEQFATVMSLLEDGIGLLIDQREYEVAADCAEAISVASAALEADDPQRKRLARVLEALAAPELARKITGALGLYRHTSPEHAACRRILAVLGGHTVDGLLEALAAESDMAGRKLLIDLISGFAADYVPEIGAHVSDKRWYLVRNVVAILGSTRSHAALRYLRQALKHQDPRVRREAIRALSLIRESASDSLLVTALADEDAQNVQLAARYLGSLACRTSAPFLADVARGLGEGNRDHGPRIEAIEALGRIGEPESVQILQRIARAWRLFGGGDKEVRVAAERALLNFGKRAPVGGARA